MAIYNFKENVNPNKNNYSSICPISGVNAKRKRINGEYVYERFYTIDFYGIKNNSYVVSSFGRVFSLINNIEMKITKRSNGYNVITLQTDIGPRVFMVHCLVARAFVLKTVSDKKMNRLFVHHKNWDNDYNYYWNLEWRSIEEIAIIRKIQSNKEDINEDILVNIICRLLESQTPIVDIFEIIERRISKDKISKIKNKQIYTFISDKYHF